MATRGSLHHYGNATCAWLITTGRIASQAREEASAEGAQPCALFAGSDLARAMEKARRRSAGALRAGQRRGLRSARGARRRDAAREGPRSATAIVIAIGSATVTSIATRGPRRAAAAPRIAGPRTASDERERDEAPPRSQGVEGDADEDAVTARPPSKVDSICSIRQLPKRAGSSRTTRSSPSDDEDESDGGRGARRRIRIATKAREAKPRGVGRRRLGRRELGRRQLRRRSAKTTTKSRDEDEEESDEDDERQASREPDREQPVGRERGPSRAALNPAERGRGSPARRAWAWCLPASRSASS